MKVSLVVLVSIGTLFAPSQAPAQKFPQALPEGSRLQDHRLGRLRTLNDYFPMATVDSPEAWSTRAGELRRQVLVATGLWPMPTRLPLQPVIHGRIDRDDFTVEKVYFESFPGHYVSGSLYRPKELARGQRVPGILSPHGHWKEGRFHDHGDKELRKQLDEGGERFESGRHPLQARCVQLARMGCVVFHYDMVGYADSQQLDHRQSRMKANGLFSTRAELRQQNMMGIQTFNSIRALDFVSQLPDIDADRIGVTGGSGGGTQTFILGAVDDRPAALFPAVMVGTAMQGGCVCENANYLRVGAGNVDFAALAAPRPQGLTGADDWTIEIESKGKPELEALYEMLAARSKFEVHPFLRFGHNYNVVSRQAMYGFFNRHFQLGYQEPMVEGDFTPLTQEEMSVWNAAHPAPRSRDAVHEAALLQWWHADAQAQLTTLSNRMADDATAQETFQSVIGGAWEAMLGRRMDEVGAIDYHLSDKIADDRVVAMSAILTATEHNEQVPCLFLHPAKDWNGEVVVVVHGEGKAAALLDADGKPRESMLTFIDEGFSVMAMDTLLTGEFTQDGKAVTVAPLNETPGRSKVSAYMHGYNRPLFAKRVHDVLTALAFVNDNPQWEAKALHLVGADSGGSALALAARSQASKSVTSTMVQVDGWRFGQVAHWHDPWFMPGSEKMLDLMALAALAAPSPLLLADTMVADHGVVQQAYLAHDLGDQLEIREKMPTGRDLVAWIQAP